MSDVAALQRELENLGRRIGHGLAKVTKKTVGSLGDLRGTVFAGDDMEQLARLSLFYAALEERLARALDRLEVPESHGERRRG